jgi:ABC-type amino acid transport substrate-binding protein
MMRRKRTVQVAVVVGALLAVAACSSGSAKSSSPQSGASTTGASPAGATKTIKVASSLGLAPYEFVDKSGNATGYEVEIAEDVMGKLGYKIDWVKTPFSQLFTGLQGKKFEMGASGVYEKCSRLKDTAQYGVFTLPIGEAGQTMTERKDGPAITGWDSLKGLKLGVESAGSTADGLADKNKDAGFTKTIYPDVNALMLALQQGRIDVALESTDVTNYTIKGNSALKVAWQVPDTQVPFGWVLRAGDPLLDQVNTAITDQRKSGALAAIYNKWFGADPPSDHPASASATVVPITTENCKNG